MKDSTRLYMVRHGQTDLNRDNRFRGMSDAPLNEAGRAEARGAARLLKGKGVTRVYTSPTPRSVETARTIAGELGCGLETSDGLIDLDYGDWQGLTVGEVRERFGEGMVESWIRNTGDFSFPGGESMRAVRDRVGPALLQIVRENEGAAVAAVTHMAVLKICFLVTMDLGFEWFWKIGIDNGSVSLFTYSEGPGFVLESWNNTPLPAGG